MLLNAVTKERTNAGTDKFENEISFHSFVRQSRAEQRSSANKFYYAPATRHASMLGSVKYVNIYELEPQQIETDVECGRVSQTYTKL